MKENDMKNETYELWFDIVTGIMVTVGFGMWQHSFWAGLFAIGCARVFQNK